MEINIIASGSSGNCVYVKNGNTGILLDAGVSPDRMWQAGVRFSAVDAVLITHEHGDHSKYVEKLQGMGIPLIMSQGTAQALGVKRYTQAQHGKGFPLGFLNKWFITAINTTHDAAEPLSYVISGGGEKLLFLTDSANYDVLHWRLTKIIIECNWQKDLIHDCDYRDRAITSHMSVDACIRYLGSLDLMYLNELILFHPSDRNIRIDEAADRISAECGIERNIIRWK